MANIYLSTGQSIKSDKDVYYRILEFLGNGANAFAYRCICTSGVYRGIEFVIKLQYNLSTEIRRQRFFRETDFLGACSHPAILTQYDQGVFITAQETFPFIVTNFMPETLARKLAAGELEFDTKVKFTCQLLSAIAFLQSKGIIHRDIKPKNIFISNQNAVLGDFGLIKKIEIDNEETLEDDMELINSTVMNNASGYTAMARYYRTPELVNYANNLDSLHIESDVFQLGLVLTEMFTGVNPLRPAMDLHSPIELDDVNYVHAPHHGRVIRDTLKSMLEINYQSRISVNLAIDRFTGIIQNSDYE